jgi:hypothetical protein
LNRTCWYQVWPYFFLVSQQSTIFFLFFSNFLRPCLTWKLKN